MMALMITGGILLRQLDMINKECLLHFLSDDGSSLADISIAVLLFLGYQ